MTIENFRKKNTAKLAVLIDPDKHTNQTLQLLIGLSLNAKVDFFFVGGSLLSNDTFEQTVESLKQQHQIPVVIFPGNNYQLSSKADALLMLSLISGRNAEYLIGQQVVAAPYIKQMKLKTISTGYILIDGGRTTTTSYITQTIPIPNDKPDIAVATALAGEMLGMQLIYLEAGSGALTTVSPKLVHAVKQQVQVPVIVGGGIKTPEAADALCRAGADVLVVGNVLEKSPELLMEISLAVHSANRV
ncbi:MAG: geranylgeranylglyceryl/heptaprenylglyceryl phosphate synthase [Chitinophagales bacterium]|nr:geranylgeranylglyceryl/heptaprenylglyceryl phosphate synthase [Chitinophagales bacterium]